jgi:hypothetical protein
MRHRKRKRERKKERKKTAKRKKNISTMIVAIVDEPTKYLRETINEIEDDTWHIYLNQI